MNENRLPDYLDHLQQAAADARSFVEGLAKNDFLTDKRTQHDKEHGRVSVQGRACVCCQARYSERRRRYRAMLPSCS